jgi:hypothetical protein
MKKLLTLATLVTFSSAIMANVETLKFTGQGLDGDNCSVKIIKSGNQLLDLQLNGAKKVFDSIDDELNQNGPEILSSSAHLMHSFLDPHSPQRRNFILSQATIEKKFTSRGDLIEFDFSIISDQEAATYDLMMYVYNRTKLSVDLNKDRKGNIVSVSARVKERSMNLPIRKTKDFFECKK